MSNSTGTTTVLPPGLLFIKARNTRHHSHISKSAHAGCTSFSAHTQLTPDFYCYLTSLRPNGWHGLQIVDSVTAVRWKTYHVLHSEVPGSNSCIRILTIYFILMSSGSWRNLVCHVINNVWKEISVSFFRLILRWTVRYYDLEDHNLVFAALKI